MMPVYADDLAGILPQGWDISPFEELVFLQDGPGIRNWPHVDEDVPFVNLRSLKRWTAFLSNHYIYGKRLRCGRKCQLSIESTGTLHPTGYSRGSGPVPQAHC